MTNSQIIEQAKNFWADEDAFAETPCISCGEEDECTIVNSLQEDGKWIAYVVDHDYKVTMDREGNWETTCDFSELNDAEKIFWNHTAKLYATVPLWMVEAYRGIDVDEAADSLCDDDDEDDYSAWGYDEDDDDDDDEWLDELLDDDDELLDDDDELLDDESPKLPNPPRARPRRPVAVEKKPSEDVNVPLIGAEAYPWEEESYISPFTGKVT